MHPLVRDAYKRVLWAGREYPLGLSYVRQKAKVEFKKRAELTDDVEIKRAVAAARWWEREIIGVIQLRKYRAMKRSYETGDDDSGLTFEDIARADQFVAGHGRS